MYFKTIEWKNNQVVMLDQRLLPAQEVYRAYSHYREVAQAITEMVIRGAPAIGVAGAMGVALGAWNSKACSAQAFQKEWDEVCQAVSTARPTAVNLSWAVKRMQVCADQLKSLPISEIKKKLVDEAVRIAAEDVELNRMISRHGQALIDDGDVVLTHCNAGALATAGFGTALGVLYAAKEAGKKFRVFADETRPYLQGARLTAWELHKNDIPVTLITDNMAGWIMKKEKVSKVIVGADRIAANGDVANKIGTYGVAILAREHGIPFYVAAPFSTIDLAIKTGDEIIIEERAAWEVTHIGDRALAPEGISVRNPSFDVTPHRLVSAIITERGIVRRPYIEQLSGIAFEG